MQASYVNELRYWQKFPKCFGLPGNYLCRYGGFRMGKPPHRAMIEARKPKEEAQAFGWKCLICRNYGKIDTVEHPAIIDKLCELTNARQRYCACEDLACGSSSAQRVMMAKRLYDKANSIAPVEWEEDSCKPEVLDQHCFACKTTSDLFKCKACERSFCWTCSRDALKHACHTGLEPYLWFTKQS